LADISVSKTNPRKLIDEVGLQELIDSIREKGVIQPILLRANGTAGKYELVCGERRYRASVAIQVAFKSRNEIPAYIRELTDDEAFDLQITENLQRKDVHPLDEAIAYKRLQDKDPARNTVQEMATRFAKSQAYITQRLSFNNMIPEFQKEFYEGKFATGHAVLLSRLTKEDQFRVKKEARGGYYFNTVDGLYEWIERNIVHNLGKANFKQDDAILYPEAGACLTCPKRTGSNRLLFPDIKENDRCMDAKCFAKKSDLIFQVKLREIIETRPEVQMIMSSNHDSDKEAVKLTESLGVKVLKDGAWETYSNRGHTKKAKGFYLNGYHKGEIADIYLPGKDKDGKKIEGPEKPAAVQIAEINERERRNKELDLEKVHKVTLEKLQLVKDLKNPQCKLKSPWDRAIMVFLLLTEAADYQARDKIKSALKTLPKQPAYSARGYKFDYFEKLGKISDSEINFIIRTICLEKYGNPKIINSIDEKSTTLRLIASYAGIDLKSIEAAQADIAVKRQDRVKKRIADLQVKKKESASKKPKAAAAATAKVSVKKVVTKKKKSK
ncbi:MAG TPA: ParB/RepB/Spo0J family partition protein, partial [Chitinophagaceae bacterium]